MRLIFILFFGFFSLNGFSQNGDIRLYGSTTNNGDTLPTIAVDSTVKNSFDLDYSQKDGKVSVEADSRLASLNEFSATPQTGQSGVKMLGYRLQIYYDGEKNVINQKKADYLARYKDQPAYLNYKAPNFRLRVGDFRTRLQAEKYMNEIRNDWPDAIIVEDDIDLPTLE